MKKNIAVIGGGYSGEFEISIKSASVVSANLDHDLYNPYLITITDSEWFFEDSHGIKHHVDREDFSIGLPSGKVRFDCIFNAIHGTPGEDGRLQVYFDELGIPYTSSDFVTSALTFNKFFCNCFAATLNVLTARSMLIRHGEDIQPEAIMSEIGLPCFIKPNKGGSSVGVSKVRLDEEIRPAALRAFDEDDEIIIEEYIPGREITCGVLRRDGVVFAMPLTEIVSKNEFFDYEAKYHGKSDEITPAPVPETIESQCRKISLKLYEELGCKGVVRFDYIYNDKGMYFLEVNTIPGLTKESIVPQQARECGMALKDLFSQMLEQSLSGI